MKNLIKKTTATFILLTVFTISAFADGPTQCPPPPPPCGNMQCPAACLLDDRSTVDSKNGKDQESDDLTSIILRIFKKIGFLF